MNGVKVLYNEFRHATRLPGDDDKWDRGDTAAVLDIISVKASTTPMFKVPFELEKGRTYYLVWADYSTGDSFGYDDNMVEFIDLFINKSLAEKAVVALSEEREEYTPESYSRTYLREGLTYITTHVPWVGSFERLNSINITEVICDG
jgi:hypothetical protein